MKVTPSKRHSISGFWVRSKQSILAWTDILQLFIIYFATSIESFSTAKSKGVYLGFPQAQFGLESNNYKKSTANIRVNAWDLQQRFCYSWKICLSGALKLQRLDIYKTIPWVKILFFYLIVVHLHLECRNPLFVNMTKLLIIIQSL